MLGELLKPILQAYFLLEEQYYKLLDVLEERFGAPVYDYFVEPIESRGIPSFLVALLLFLLLVGGSLLILTAAQAPSLQVTVYGKLDATHSVLLDGAVVELSDGATVLSTQKTKKGRVTFENVPVATLTVRAHKDGYKASNSSVNVAEKAIIRLELACTDAQTCAKDAINPIDDPSNVPYNDPNKNPYLGLVDDPSYLGPGDNQSIIDFCDTDDDCPVDPSSPTGRLLIIARDKDGNPVEGQATVYDAKTNGIIENVDLVQGNGLVPSLAVGRQVYVNVFAAGFEPYFGNNTIISIRPATNKITVTLKAGGGVGPCPECNKTLKPNQVRIRVVEKNGSAIDDVRVDIYLPERVESIYHDNSNAEGEVLLSVGAGSYYASGDKYDHIRNETGLFQGGQEVVLVLPELGRTCTGSDCVCTGSSCVCTGSNCCTGSDCVCTGSSCTCTGSNCCTGERCQTECEQDPSKCPDPGRDESQLLVHAVEESGGNASYADVVLHKQHADGYWFVLDQQSTTHNGEAMFTRLAIGSKIKAKVALYDESGEANATLVQGVNRLQVNLSKTPFLVKAYAYDPLARQFVANARFVSFVGNKTVGQCQGNGCNLTMRSGEDVSVNVSADGFVGSQNSFYLYEGIDRNVTLYLVNESVLADTYVQWQGLFTSQNRPVSGSLKPGYSYLAKVQMFSRNADQSGVVLDTQNDDVIVSGLDPSGFDVKGSYAESCYASAISDFERSRASWVDTRYNGAASGLVTFNVSLEPSMTLDTRTKTKVLSLAYRSYIVRGSDYVRHPYDAALLTRPASPHASGCPDTAALHRNYTIKSLSTTCDGQACLSLTFAQGAESGSDGFSAHNQVLVNNRRLEPLQVYYKVELFSRPTANTELVLQAPASGLVLFNATTPIIGSATLGTGKRCDFLRGKSFDVWNASFGLNLSDLTQCTNYALPLRFEGVAKGRVLQAGSVNVSLVLRGLNETPLEHAAALDISGFGVSANEHGIVEAQLGQPENQLADAHPYSALSTGNCTASQVIGAQCDVGFVNATFRITALSGNTLAASVSAGTGLELYDVQPAVSIPVTQRGQSFQGVARFLSPDNAGLSSITIRRALSGSSTELVRDVRLGGAGFSFNGSNPFPPGWDTCNGYIGIRYEPALNPPFSLGQGCTDLAFRVSPIFPADAVLLNVSVPDYGQVLTRASRTDGSDKCYEICEWDAASGTVFGCGDLGKTLYNDQPYLLRYSPELRSTCPDSYKVNGNSLKGSEVTLEFTFTGDQTSRRNVTLHVINDASDSNAYISPIYTFYSSAASGTSRFYPQLWAVTNLKQLGKRSIVFTRPSNFALTFDGPGTKIFAVNPGLAGSIQAFDASDLDTPIFDSTNPLSPIRPVSRYSYALATERYSYDLSTPYSQAITQLLTESISENAFLRVDVAEKLSASVPGLASRTAYWRSNNAVHYCQQTQTCLASHYTLPGCCREALEAWMNYSVQIQYRQEACTFCSNTFNPDCSNTQESHIRQYLQCTNDPAARKYNCDQRCTARSVYPADVQARFSQLNLPGTGITLDALSGQRVRYGDSIGGRTCEMVFSSLNAFVEFTPNSYTYYVPTQPQDRITDDAVNRCESNGQCPLVFATASDVFVGSTTPTPKCMTDANNDGLWQPNEALTVSTHRAAVGCHNNQIGCQPVRAQYNCPFGQVLAVEESRFFQPARVNGVIPARSIATAADLQKCRGSLCPLVVNPSTAADDANVPLCFRDNNGNGLLDDSSQAEVSSTVYAQATGFGGYQCDPGYQLAVSNSCLSSCENYCSQPNCDPSLACLPSGVKNVPTGQTTRTLVGWLNQSPVVPVEISVPHLSRGKPFLPAALFPDAYISNDGRPEFIHSYVVNSKLQGGALQSLSKVLSVSGCGPGGDYPYDSTLFPDQGIYEIRDGNSIERGREVWTAQATAMELLQANYLGARQDLCRKNNWNVKLCELVYVDSSPAFGACFNSILKFSPASKRLGVDGDVPLLGGFGYGVKNGLGWGVSPGGEVFAQLEPGNFEDKCEGDHKVHYDYQTLNHWSPMGQNTGQQRFTWRQDLGCKEECGCPKKKKGYGFFNFILQIFGLYNPNDGGGGGIFAGLEGLSAVGGDAGASSAELRSNLIRTSGGGIPCNDAKSWRVGDATAFACKNTLWSISP